jgi:very-short-patch-repair endonuclease
VSEGKNDNMQSCGHIRDKAIRLFTYLLELTQLRSKVIRAIENYDSVMWLSDIPHEQECFTLAWGAARDENEEVWLEIKKPKLLPFPPPSEEISPWVKESDLADSSKDEPELLQRIPVPVIQTQTNQTDTSLSETKYIELNDHLHILDLWSEYLEKEWKPWAKECKRLKRVQACYAKLFSMYQKQKSLGETYEIIIGFGLLSWQTPNNQKIFRHLITVQATIMFDSYSGTLSVVSPAEGIKLTLEQDMLEASERPIPDDQNKIEQKISEIDDAIWNTAKIEEVLRSWVYSVSSEGTYKRDLTRSVESTHKPFVSYSPAIILRKRTSRGLVKVYQDIIEQLRSGNEIPPGVIRVVEIIDDRHGNDGSSGVMSGINEFHEIFFPLPANDEQKRIIETLNAHQGVLVQGPPGTGKSHTIVNLICHLLATGKKVLVTSQTPRALKVLKEKILNEGSTRNIAPLCVSLLGHDSSALKDMEDAVLGIVEHLHRWDSQRNSQRICELRQELDKLRRKNDGLTRQLREIRERETYVHSLLDGLYHGKAQQIAQHIAREQIKYHWIMPIQVNLTEAPPLTNQEALELLRLYRELFPERINEVRRPIVFLGEIPTPEEFIKLCDKEKLAQANYDQFANITQSDIYRRMKSLNTDHCNQLKDAIDMLQTTRISILRNSQPWIDKAVNDILSNRDRVWRELYDKSSKLLDGLLKKAQDAEERTINLPKDYDRVVILTDAKTLLEHLQNGGGFGIPVFRPKPIKSAWYIISKTKVNGKLCNEIHTIKILIDTLVVEEILDKLWSYWKSYINRIESSLSSQVIELEYLCNQLKDVLNLHKLTEEAMTVSKDIVGLPLPAWQNTENVEMYQRILEGIIHEQNLEDIRSTLNKADQVFRMALTKPDVHPVVTEGYRALLERDEKAYGVFYEKLLNLNGDRNSFIRQLELEKKLSKAAPSIVCYIKAKVHEASLDGYLACFVESWRWAQVKTWIEKYIEGASEAQISHEIHDIQHRIGIITGSLAAAMAWSNCLNRLINSPYERESLIAWKQAMRRGGKWTGKRVEIHRRDARKLMEVCLNAIQSWIMPLYRVAETIKPTRDAFDVVIIDEASQSGPEAFFLQFIAKKIIVVGDDMQISPESIGVTRDDVDRLQDRYIKDLPLPHIGALGVEETSFFHLAEILFGGRIILREHFRCMPEIIQFSNELCYRNTPLIPLRQYPPNRLKPVVTRYVPEGYREGDTRTPRNPPEAEEIVKIISECCKNPVYENKTMGVISLLGEYQVRLIEQKLLEYLEPEEIERRNLICGDAYAFQGDERDVIFLSLVAAPGETAMTALTSQRYMRRFNVAASRARDQMWLFHTPTINDFRNKECLRYKLLSYCLNPKVQSSSIEGINIEQLKSEASNRNRTEDNFPKPFGSWFEIDVFLQIIGKGYRVIPQFEFAGYFIDMVVEGMHGRLAVECDGDKWHGPDRYENDMMRQRMLERCGWTFWRIRGSEFYYNPERALSSLWELLKKLRIAPGGEDIEIIDNKFKENNNSKNEEKKDSPSSRHKECLKNEKIVDREQIKKDNQNEFQKQLSLFSSQKKTGKYADREEKLEAILSIMPSQEPMLRGEAIRVAAKSLKDKGRIEFQRVRENGYVWNEFKAAITLGIRRGLLDGDNTTIWKVNLNGLL